MGSGVVFFDFFPPQVLTDACLTKEYDQEVAPSTSISLDVGETDNDRVLSPRGTTPLLDIDRDNEHVPDAYRYCYPDREYFSLLERGATPLMCETFELEFSEEHGIIAWADDEIYDNFAGPMMKPGDLWKIHLGRRVCLDPYDFDGAQFLDDFLEENLLFPIGGKAEYLHSPYETVLESPGIWATRPRQGIFEPVEGEDDNDFATNLLDETLDEEPPMFEDALDISSEDDWPVFRAGKGYVREDTTSDFDTHDDELRAGVPLACRR
jgi:hypothetical protein